ncbi:SCP2 sterol-binding domain-containing protein [Micromonospora sp. WMMD882]|uniref:SCP2 sterol-binding domain-containing protein n=1 Tax=Micromonospora sp. WMMD882 TaxID=3015151 RepID=UPI00248B952D|nr:SCP2 sterol-binding domain-containing protein [Micromonospora sp. WMMD882]WBB82349.1 SCP2 sterol-binding domain-containing protein [Micromonospora sp. WMMD882]
MRDYLANGLAGRHTDLPETTAGTIRLDVTEDGWTDHWYLTIADQVVRVTRSADEAELVVQADREVFDELASGRARIAATLLRNDLTAQGRLPLLMSLRRLFPGPQDARHPRDVAREGGDRR